LNVKLIPIKDTLKVLPWSTKNAIVFTRMLYGDLTPYEGCPRFLLEKVCAEACNMGY